MKEVACAAAHAQLDAVRRVRDGIAAKAPDETVMRHSAEASMAGSRARESNKDGPGLEIIRTLDAALAAYGEASSDQGFSKMVAEAEAKVRAEHKVPADAPGLPELRPSTAPASADKGDELLKKAEAAMAGWK